MRVWKRVKECVREDERKKKKKKLFLIDKHRMQLTRSPGPSVISDLDPWTDGSGRAPRERRAETLAAVPYGSRSPSLACARRMPNTPAHAAPLHCLRGNIHSRCLPPAKPHQFVWKNMTMPPGPLQTGLLVRQPLWSGSCVDMSVCHELEMPSKRQYEACCAQPEGLLQHLIMFCCLFTQLDTKWNTVSLKYMVLPKDLTLPYVLS